MAEAPRLRARTRPLAARLLALAVGALALVPLAACRQAAPAAPPPAPPPPALVVATGSELTGVNELLPSIAGELTSDVLSAMFLHLLRERPDYQQHPPTFAPELATSWEPSADGLAITFHLRDDAHWSDGVPVTAADVRFTWQAQTSPEVGWGSSYLKEPIRDVEVVDPHTVRFHFTRPSSTQLLTANDGYILPQHVWGALPFARWGESGDWFRNHLVVDGPFTLSSWQPQQQVTLAANRRYYRPGRPRLQKVVFRVVPDEATRVQELLAGNADLVDGVPADRGAEVERTPGRRLLTVWRRQYSAIVWNTRRPPFDDPQVRRAMTLAIDRQGLIDALWGGRARVADSPVLTTIWAHPADLRPWPFDPAEARRLLAARGYQDRNGDGVLDRAGRPLSFELSTTTNNQLRRDAVVLVQEQLRRAGVRVEPAFRESAVQTARLRGHDFDAAYAAWGIDTGLDLRYGFDSRDPDETNWGRYRNPEVDRLLDAIDAAPDRLAAKPLFARLQHLLHDDQPYTFLWEPPRLIGISARLHATPSPLSTFADLDDWSLDAEPSPGRGR
ncbi:MAG TPA: ABC transporter substrate-binding protein [Thermoanaerobaculia bacterium]|nr:ABC transporter substrate-binding protein [Thermoanaerobaculia bacterium]